MFKVVVIDDRDLAGKLAQNLAEEHGFPTRAIRVRDHTTPSRAEMNELIRKVKMFQPLVVICDKGLGYTDGLEVIRLLNEEGYITILFTGEWDTDEIRRAGATHFVEKINVHEIFQILGDYWQKMQPDNH